MLKKNHHHFTKTELVLEEIIIVVAICFLFAAAALGSEALLPVKVSIVRCVTEKERLNMCEQRELCCHLIDKGRNPSLQSFPGDDNGLDYQPTTGTQGTYPDTYEGQTMLQ